MRSWPGELWKSLWKVGNYQKILCKIYTESEKCYAKSAQHFKNAMQNLHRIPKKFYANFAIINKQYMYYIKLYD